MFSRNCAPCVKPSRDTPGGSSGFAGRGISQEINRQATLLRRINRLIRDRQLLAAEILKIEQQITTETTRQVARPTSTFEGGVERPRATLFPQARPETSVGGRSLAEIGPPSDALSIIQALGQTLSEEVRSIRLEPIRPTNLALFPEFGDSASLQANLTQGFLNALRQAREIQPAVSPTSPFIAGAPADLSGGISDVRRVFEILRIESRDLLNRLQVDARVASIPVLNFARGLRSLGGVLRQAKQESDGLTAAVDAGRRRFAQQVEAEIFQSQQFSRSAVETGTGLAFDLTDLPAAVDTVRRSCRGSTCQCRSGKRRIVLRIFSETRRGGSKTLRTHGSCQHETVRSGSLKSSAPRHNGVRILRSAQRAGSQR